MRQKLLLLLALASVTLAAHWRVLQNDFVNYDDNDYVTAENAGALPLIANRTAIGPWEEFDLIND